MPKSRGKSAKKNIEEDDDLVGSITEKLKRLGKEDDVDHEIGDGFDVLTEEEVEMFLMDALWVNERLHDYTTTVGSVPIKKQGEEGNEHGVLDIEWSEDEDELADISFEEKIPMPKAADVCQPLPPINSYARPPRKAWDLPVLTNEVLSDHQIGRKPLSLEIRQT